MAKFVVTAGHSDTDPGAVANGVTESEIAEDMRNMIAGKLRSRGHTVITDGTGSHNQSLNEAIKLVKQGDLAIEIHCNAAGTSSACGVETISLPNHKELSSGLAKLSQMLLVIRFVVTKDGLINHNHIVVSSDMSTLVALSSSCSS